MAILTTPNNELTGNDIALANMELVLAIRWHEAQPKSDFNAKQIEKINALRAKLNRILDWAYPDGYEDVEDGDETLLVTSRDMFGDVDGRAEARILRTGT